MFSHASIVPLIGGESIGATRAHGQKPDYFLSYKAFEANDSHIRNYYKDVPYYVLDEGGKAPHKVDVVHTVCPCAGLSTLSHGFGDDNENNKWMIETANYILGDLQPRVFWGENAPGFAGKIGENIRNQLREIGKKFGYTMSVYRTKSLLHGLPQVRERSFYFFWKDTKVPLMNWYKREYTPIEDLIRNVKSNFQTEPINPKKPTDNPYYKYLLEELKGGMTHAEFAKEIDGDHVRNSTILTHIEREKNYLEVAEWMAEQGLQNEVEKCHRRHEKLSKGGQIMRRTTMVPRNYIGAFVGHYPTSLTHPDEDRYINYREAMSIMGLPEDFELLNPKKSANHICQNVPVQTATDMATEVVAYLNGERKMVDTDYIIQYNHNHKVEYNENTTTLEAFYDEPATAN